MKIVDFIVSFAVLGAGFAVLFEYLPERKIEWRDVWVAPRSPARYSAQIMLFGAQFTRVCAALWIPASP